MNFVQIRCVTEVAATGSITKAGENLNMAQPNLSRTIIDLEKELGQKLFERDPKGMKLTEFGEKFCERGKRLVDEYNSFTNYLTKEEEIVRFSLSSIISAYIIGAFGRFLELKKDIPSFSFRYKEGGSHEVLENVLAGKSDIGILRYEKSLARTYEKLFAARGIASKKIVDFNYLVTFNKDHPLAEKEIVSMNDLKESIYVALETNTVSPAADDEPFEFRRKIQLSDASTTLDVACHNKEAFFFATPLSRETLERHNCVQRKCEETEKIEYEDVLIHREDYTLSEYDILFIDQLKME